jgi:FMN phosphatase YigB (HAD superfamily)
MPHFRSKSVFITDLDNTLFDWVELWHRAFKTLLDRLTVETGIETTVLKREFRSIHQKHGTSEYAFSIEELSCLQEKYPGEDLSGRFRMAIDEYRSLYLSPIALYPGVQETLTTLKEKGCLLVGYTESREF